MTQEDIKNKAFKQADKVHRDLDKLITSIEVLDGLINDYRSYGIDASKRQFYLSSRFSKPVSRLVSLKAWQKDYIKSFKAVSS